MKKYLITFGLIIAIFIFDTIQTYTGYKLIKLLTLTTIIIFIFYILKLLKSLIVDEYLMANRKKKKRLLIGIIGFIIFILSISIGCLLFGEFPKLVTIGILFSMTLIIIFLILEIWNYEKKGNQDE